MKILQFTDTHLFKDDRQLLCGINSAKSFYATVELAQESSHWPPDLILVTGDISQDETEGSYQRLFDALEPLDIPTFCLPGNHDVPAKLLDILEGENVHSPRQILTDDWQILLLDSCVYKQNGGFLRQEELNFLEQCLSVHDEVPTLVCLHHNLLPTNTPWLDTMTVKNAAEFFAVVDRFPNVKGIVNGHVHQELAQKWKNLTVWSTPSTCLQFKPQTVRFTPDELQPGFRWFDLKNNGTIKTGVVRVEDGTFVADPKARGY